MSTVHVSSNMQDAITIIDQTLERIGNVVMQENLRTVRAYVVEAQQAENRWYRRPYGTVAQTEEPKAVQQALDEAKFFWSIRDLIRDDSEHQKERQFHDRALAAVMSLLVRRYIILQGAGRTGDVRDANDEEWATWYGFEYARQGFGVTIAATRGAAIFEAYQIGLKGGSWASHILDGRP